MKKCPYCAENIQDSAIKCRFCGEWIDKSNNGFRNGNNPPLIESDNKFSNDVADDEYDQSIAEPRKNSSTDELANEISDESIYSPLNRKPKWGWGWFLLLFLTIPGFKLLLSYDSPIAFLIMFFGWIVVLIFYFLLRSRLIKKEKYDQKIWHKSFCSGFFAYCLALLLIGTGSFFGTIQENRKHSDFLKSLEIKGAQLQNSESEIIKKIANGPKSDEGQLKNLNDLLLLEKQKYDFLQDFIAYTSDIGKRKGNKSLITNAALLKELSEKRYDLGKSYANNLIKYQNSKKEALIKANEEIMYDLIKLRDEIAQSTDIIYSYFEKK